MNTKTLLDIAVLGDGSLTAPLEHVKVLPTRRGGHDGYVAVVRAIHELAAGDVEVTIAGVDHTKARDAIRTVAPARLRRPTAAEIRAAGEQR